MIPKVSPLVPLRLDARVEPSLAKAQPRKTPRDELSELLAGTEGLSRTELERLAASLPPETIDALVERAPRSPAAERLLRHRLTAIARSFTGKLYFAGAATVSIDDEDHDGEADYLPERTYERRSNAFFGALGKETNVDDFALWIRGEAGKPGPRGKMNCWEAIFLLAHESGVLSRERLFGFYENAERVGREAMSQSTYFRELGNALGLDRADPDRAPQPGDIVFFQSDLGYGGMEHVALALGTVDAKGRHEILSLWQIPGGPFGFKSHLQKTTIEELTRAAERYGLQLHPRVAPMPFVLRPQQDTARLPSACPDTAGCRIEAPVRAVGVLVGAASPARY